MRRLAWLLLAACATEPSDVIEDNGVVCDEVETVSGIRACLTRATLDGAPFNYNLSPVGAQIDLDENGIQDLILSPDWSVKSEVRSAVQFFRGDGNGRDFHSYAPTFQGGAPEAQFVRAIPVGDFDDDGHDDFALPDGTEYATDPSGFPFLGTTSYLYRGLGGGVFQKLDMGIGTKTVHGVGQGILSRDGFALALNTPWQQTANLMNTVHLGPNGAVASQLIRSDEPLFAPFDQDAGAYCYTLAIDADTDGRQDLVMLTRYVHGEHTVWHNEGDGTFTVAHTVPVWVDGIYQAESTAVADFDGDGHDDFVALHIDRRTEEHNGDSALRLYRNDKAGSFADDTAAWLGTSFQDDPRGFHELLAADVNSDGRPDLVFTTGSGSPGSTVYASLVLLINRDGTHFEQVEFNLTQWRQPLATPDQWMAGSPVRYDVAGRPTFLISKGIDVYSVRFR